MDNGTTSEPVIIVTADGDMVDALAFAHYGTHEGTTELVYEANRGLADLPLALPAGVEIVLPARLEPVRRVLVHLYD